MIWSKKIETHKDCWIRVTFKIPLIFESKRGVSVFTILQGKIKIKSPLRRIFNQKKTFPSCNHIFFFLRTNDEHYPFFFFFCLLQGCMKDQLCRKMNLPHWLACNNKFVNKVSECCCNNIGPAYLKYIVILLQTIMN